MNVRIKSVAGSVAAALMITSALAGCSAVSATTQDTAGNPEAVAASTEGQTTDVATSAGSKPNAADGNTADAASGNTAQEGAGNMAGNAMDTQPGQTTSDGFTANANGKAITETLVLADAFTERDLEQTADTANAKTVTLENGKDATITEEGVYVVSGTASEATIVVEAADTAKVQLVLDGVSITNTDAPAIYVKSADKAIVTLQGENALATTGEFTADGTTNTDAVIFSTSDLCLNGSGSLNITSSNNGITSKDDLKVTGGSYVLDTQADALEANDSIRIADGTFKITSAKDALHAENDEDDSLGYIYIQKGTFDITATDDGLQGNAFVWIDGGTFTVNAAECIEGTYIQINDGSFNLTASDDAVNASIKSSTYTPTLEINGGTMTIQMGSGDVDALDSNGYLYIKGGRIDITAQSPFDYAWGGELTGGEVTVNGTQVTELTAQMMGPGGGMGGPMSGDGQMPSGQAPGGQPPANGQMPDGGAGGFGRHGGPRDGGQPPSGDFGAPQGSTTDNAASGDTATGGTTTGDTATGGTATGSTTASAEEGIVA